MWSVSITDECYSTPDFVGYLKCFVPTLQSRMCTYKMHETYKKFINSKFFVHTHWRHNGSAFEIECVQNMLEILKLFCC